MKRHYTRLKTRFPQWTQGMLVSYLAGWYDLSREVVRGRIGL